MNPKSLMAIFAKTKKVLHPATTEPGGFTLVELMVAMAVASIMLAAVASLFTILNKSYTTQNVAAEVQQVTRAGIDFMAQNIRMAGLDPEETGIFGIMAATATSITFTADLDLDGIGGEPGEIINYSLNGDELRTTETGLGTVTLVDNVIDLRFTYLDTDGNPPADTAAIRTVRIELTVREPAGRGETVARTYATEVRCRNLGL